MRYDDMIGTVLAHPAATAAGRATAWTQIVDLLAQRRGGAGAGNGSGAGDADRGYDFLRAHRDAVPIATRAAAARALAGRRVPAGLVALFAGDLPAIAAPVLSTVRMGAEDWAALLPALTPTTRGFLRNRRDLDDATRRALAAFGATDLVLGAPGPDPAAMPADASPPAPAPGPIGVSINALVQRIDAYRRGRPRCDAPPPVVEPATDFRFEAGADGILFWVEGVPREVIVGETLAQAAQADAGHGVDGHVAGAFRRRSPFRDARLTIGGAGPAAGDWRISAVPLFAPGDGRFMGYRGTARRPRADEIAMPVTQDGSLLGAGIAPDSLRQLVHELRTPLNAIVGFADMIEGEMLGPVARDYRVQATAISEDGRRLLTAVDDLDIAARLEGTRAHATIGRIEPAAILAEVAERHAARTRIDPAIDLHIADDLPGLSADPVLFDRMLSRLLSAAVGLANPDERIAVVLDRSPRGDLRLSVARPARLAGRDERTLLDPGYAPDGDWPDAPLLGLGFSLRLVRNLATAAGGVLTIGDGAFLLHIPARSGGAEADNA